MDGTVEGVGVSEGLVGQMVRLEIAPDDLDVVELGRVFRQPFDGKPVRHRQPRRQLTKRRFGTIYYP